MSAQSRPIGPVGSAAVYSNPALYAQGKAQWLARLEASPQDVDLLAGAAQYFIIFDRPLAQGLLERGRALDPLNPRSILFQLERLKAEIGLLPSLGGEGHMSPAAKEILQLNTQIAIKEPSDMTAKALDDLAYEIGGLYNSLAKAYFG